MAQAKPRTVRAPPRVTPRGFLQQSLINGSMGPLAHTNLTNPGSAFIYLTFFFLQRPTNLDTTTKCPKDTSVECRGRLPFFCEGNLGFSGRVLLQHPWACALGLSASA